MDHNVQIDLETKLIEKLYGKLNLLQEKSEKEAFVDQALRELFTAAVQAPYQNAKEELSHEDRRQEYVQQFLSYGIIKDLLDDFEIEDIIINGCNPIYIHHSQKGLVPIERQFATRKELDIFIKKLVLFSGRRTMERILNIELPNLEGRINIVHSPFGPQVTITKAKMSPLSIIDFIHRGTMSYEVAGQLWLYMEGMSIRPANIIIAGGPGVGKTTLLNALFSFIPETDRIVVIEDTLELNTAFEESCSRLESGEDFSLAELVKNSLRMRPERIVIGEVRGVEARDMMTAANVGKYCICTIHALTSREAIIRLQNEPMNIPEDLVRLIDVFIVLKRYHVGNKVFRVVDEVSETSGMEQTKVLLSNIYKYDYERRQIRTVTTSTVYRDRLAQEAGLLPKDIMMEVQLRAFLLEQLAERNMKTLREVTSFCRAYNRNPDEAVKTLGYKREDLIGKGYSEELKKRQNH
jgi:archaeal flagellar protein FlaI